MKPKTPKLKFEVTDWDGGYPIDEDESKTYYNILLIQRMPWGDREGLSFQTATSEAKAWKNTIRELKKLLKEAQKCCKRSGTMKNRPRRD